MGVIFGVVGFAVECVDDFHSDVKTVSFLLGGEGVRGFHYFSFAGC